MKKLLMLGMLLSSLLFGEWKAYHPLDEHGKTNEKECEIEGVGKNGVGILNLSSRGYLGSINFIVTYGFGETNKSVLEFIIDQNEPIKIEHEGIPSLKSSFSFNSYDVSEDGKKGIIKPEFKLLMDQMRKGRELKIVAKNGRFLIFSLEGFEDAFKNFMEIHEKKFINSKRVGTFFQLYKKN